MMIHGNLLFDKRKDRQSLEGVEEKQEIKLKGGKGKKYKDSWVLLQRETAIYRGGTTAKE